MPLGNSGLSVNYDSERVNYLTQLNTTSGTSIDYSIPSWVKKITILIDGVSTSGTNALQVQLGTSGGIDGASYVATRSALVASAATTVDSTTGFVLTGVTATSVITGKITIENLGGNTWVQSGTVFRANETFCVLSSGSKTLSGVLTTVRFTTVGSTDTFDAGTINVFYEGI